MALLYIKKRFQSVIHRDEFLNLSPDGVVELLSLQDLDLGKYRKIHC